MSRLTRRFFVLAIGIAGFVSSGFAQRTATPAPAPSAPATPTPTTPSIPSRPTSPTNPTDPNNVPWNNNTQQQMQRPIFLSGKVMLDSGGPPPDSVVIQRVCSGSPRGEAYTDSKGRFSFQLGQNNMMMQDASTSAYGSGIGGSRSGVPGGFGQSNGISERELMNCDIRASLVGYRSDLIPLSGRRYMDNPDLGTIILHRIGNVEGVSISASSLNAPKDAKKAYEKSADLLKKNKTAEAQKEIEKALGIYPAYAAAWYDLGRIKEKQNDTDGARDAYLQAVAADAKYVNPYNQLAQIYFKQAKWQDVAETTGKLIKLDPVDFPEAHYYNALANYYLKNLDAADKSIRELQKLDTQNRLPKSSKLLGAILMEKQDYPGAVEQFKKYLSYLPPGQDDAAVKKELAELEKAASVSSPAASPQ